MGGRVRLFFSRWALTAMRGLSRCLSRSIVLSESARGNLVADLKGVEYYKMGNPVLVLFCATQKCNAADLVFMFTVITFATDLKGLEVPVIP